ncbi:MAG: hypothetical protein AVDCRST_MAG39-2319 [uncultured Sphingomonadaceae bacterium]|uniref:DUF1697 domain-containing protein n=1 Tax=uncultured Sphingomonadaceae bacterium TaxID=169976 RepID=A0A6J4TAD6_9SPHN|nr:MAG: hypothetical protein AVDCRST_MAG39-2319 [uncultured Sphingomonadaceae bacterium]
MSGGAPARRVALLRAVNVGGRKVAMAELRAAVAAAGFRDVATLIASGNLLYAPQVSAREEEADLERVIAQVFGIAVPVVVRAGEDWPDYLARCPMPDAARERPNRFLLFLSKLPPRSDAAEQLAAKAAPSETVVLVGDALWIDFADGGGRSKLTPSAIDRAMGSPATGRNHNTVVRLGELAR